MNKDEAPLQDLQDLWDKVIYRNKQQLTDFYHKTEHIGSLEMETVNWNWSLGLQVPYMAPQ